MDEINRLPRMLASLLVAIAITICAGACSAAGAPSGSPAASAAPSGGAPVTSEEDAVARVVEREPRFSGITKRDPDMIGQASWYEVAPASGVGAFTVTFRVGWGDCPSGCIEEHKWVYAVAPDGTVTLESEGGNQVPPNAFPIPGTGG